MTRTQQQEVAASSQCSHQNRQSKFASSSIRTAAPLRAGHWQNTEIWSNLPTKQASRHGLRLDALTPRQLEAALAPLRCVLSNEGYVRFSGVRTADDYLASHGGGSASYGSGRYFIAFLGHPSTSSTWRLQITGHHYALNRTFNAPLPGSTPFFVGVEPPTFTAHGRTFTVLDKQQSAASALTRSLQASATAVLPGQFNDVVMGVDSQTGHDTQYPRPYPHGGALYSSLSTDQQALTRALIAAWVDDQDPATAAQLLSTYEDDSALAKTVVGYAGSGTLQSVGDYVRVDGPRVWIEFVVQKGFVFPDGIHYHSLWRDKVADYGGSFEPADKQESIRGVYR